MVYPVLHLRLIFHQNIKRSLPDYPTFFKLQVKRSDKLWDDNQEYVFFLNPIKLKQNYIFIEITYFSFDNVGFFF